MINKNFLLCSLSAFILSQSQAQAFYYKAVAARKTYADIRLELKSIAASYPGNAEIVTISDSDSGLPIEGLKIGSGSVNHLIVATHHGNEYGATEVAMASARDLAEHPIADRTVFVVPVLNIYGYDKKNRYERVNNFAYSDPNRDYAGPCGSEGPWKLKSTTGMAKFVNDQKIVSAATLHTYWPAVMYPWGNNTNNYSTLYDNLFIKLAQSATYKSNYETGFSGAVVYPVDGTFEDYVYWKNGVWSLLFELGGSHFPSQNDIDEMNRVNVPGLRKMMEDAPVATAEDHRFTAACQQNKGIDPRLD